MAHACIARPAKPLSQVATGADTMGKKMMHIQRIRPHAHTPTRPHTHSLTRPHAHTPTRIPGCLSYTQKTRPRAQERAKMIIRTTQQSLTDQTLEMAQASEACVREGGAASKLEGGQVLQGLEVRHTSVRNCITKLQAHENQLGPAPRYAR